MLSIAATSVRESVDERSVLAPSWRGLARALVHARSGAYRAQRCCCLTVTLLCPGPSKLGFCQGFATGPKRPKRAQGPSGSQVLLNICQGSKGDHQDPLTLLDICSESNRVPVLSVPWHSEVISCKGAGDSNRRSLRRRSGEFDSILPRNSIDYVFHDDVRGCQLTGSQGHAGPRD